MSPARSASLPRVAGRRGRTSAAITIEETPEKIVVDTGAVSFNVSKKNFGLLDALATGGDPVLKSSSLYWVREDGRRFETKPYGMPEVVVETDGPFAPSSAPRAGTRPSRAATNG